MLHESTKHMSDNTTNCIGFQIAHYLNKSINEPLNRAPFTLYCDGLGTWSWINNIQKQMIIVFCNIRTGWYLNKVHRFSVKIFPQDAFYCAILFIFSTFSIFFFFVNLFFCKYVNKLFLCHHFHILNNFSFIFFFF